MGRKGKKKPHHRKRSLRRRQFSSCPPDETQDKARCPNDTPPRFTGVVAKYPLALPENGSSNIKNNITVLGPKKGPKKSGGKQEP